MYKKVNNLNIKVVQIHKSGNSAALAAGIEKLKMMISNIDLKNINKFASLIQIKFLKSLSVKIKRANFYVTY